MKIQTFSSTIRRKEMDAVLTCMVAEKTGPGKMNQRLCQYAKEFFLVDGVVALRSPAIALKYALKALGLAAGSGVMISALAPAWQILALEDMGFNPIVLDVSGETGLVIADNVAEGMRNGGRVLLIHETMGIVPNFTALAELNVPIIEDISHSVGASLNEKNTGSFGIFSICGLEEYDSMTAGGGALLMAPERRNWTVLKKYTDMAPSTDTLPDINSALAFVQLKEFNKNEAVRKEIYEVYIRSLMQGKHKTFSQQNEYVVPSVYSFPVILSGGMKDVKQYALRKDVEIVEAYGNSVIALREEELESCVQAKSLLLRCVFFPLYPRLGGVQTAKVAKVLATLP
ncbi:MAG: DegT/DnrJ/EryC1/StrS aminotransferase family protein [Treponema sp.]|nr:DegT/DnrJ/EryC1/StrS aminotransferase family protein [Treponema sp.]